MNGRSDSTPPASRRQSAADLAALLANREVLRTSEERTEYAGMGTTLTAAVVEGAHVTLVSVGDTRPYARDSELQQITRDDSLVGALADVPGVDPKSLEHQFDAEYVDQRSDDGRRLKRPLTSSTSPTVSCCCRPRPAAAEHRHLVAALVNRTIAVQPL